MMNSRKQKKTDLLNDCRVRQNAPGKHGSPKRSRCQFAAKKQRDQYTGAMLLVDAGGSSDLMIVGFGNLGDKNLQIKHF